MTAAPGTAVEVGGVIAAPGTAVEVGAAGAAAGDGLSPGVGPSGAPAGSMDHELAADMAGHWWYRGRAAAVSALLRRAGAPRGGRILDFGCGTGHMGRTLACFGRVYGVDGEQAAIRAGRAAGGFPGYVWVGRADVEDLLGARDGLQPSGRLPAGPFTVIACLDVLEHVPDDAGMLRALAALLAADGLLVASVPMRPDLFCEIDRLSGHVRRYSPARLARLFADAGLRPVAASGYVVALLPAAVARRRRILAGRGVAGAEFATPAAPLNAALSAVAVAEGRLARRLSLPPGLSQITVLRRVAGVAPVGAPDTSAGTARSTGAAAAAVSPPGEAT